MAISKIRQVIVNGKKKQVKEYYTWASMRRRCNNPNDRAYKWYGGRGIKVCKRWMDSYENFLSDMGNAPHSRMTLERKNVNKGYNKNNCIWATYKVQANNTRSNRRITYNGITDTFIQTAEREGLNYKALWHQVTRQGLTIDEAKIKQARIKNRPTLTKDLLIELYVVRNLNCRDLAKKTGWEKGAVQKKLKEFHIPTDRFKRKNKNRAKKSPLVNLNNGINEKNGGA